MFMFSDSNSRLDHGHGKQVDEITVNKRSAFLTFIEEQTQNSRQMKILVHIASLFSLVASRSIIY